MSSNKASPPQHKLSSNSAAYTFSKASVTALLFSMIVMSILLALITKQQSFITDLEQQNNLEDSLISAEYRIDQLNSQMLSNSATHTALAHQLQVTYQELNRYLLDKQRVSALASSVSKEEFQSAYKSLSKATAEETAKQTRILLYTLVELPPTELKAYIDDDFSLLPLLKSLKAEENAVLLRIQALREKMLIATLFGAVALALCYLYAWLFTRNVPKSSLRKLNKSKVRLAIADNSEDLQDRKFLQLISHEFRAPISAIISALELIPNMEDQKAKLIQQAEQSSYRLLNLTNNLTEILNNHVKDDLQVSKVDLISLLDECISPFSVRVKDKKLELNMHCSHSVPNYAETDAMALSKVIVNIMDNAVKFTSTGLIDVTVTTLVKNKKVFLVIIINDTGIGIDEQTQKRMFERFYRGEHSQSQRYPGAGIGLSVAKRSLDKLGGTLQVNSTLGVGSEFKISLPIKPLEDSPSVTSTPSNAKFAIVDDLEISRLYLQSIVTKEGFSVRTFSSGANLLNLHDELLQFSGIIADLYMPGMNGLELIKTLKAIYGERVPPVIVLSATPDIANIIAKSELPIFQSFVKPIDRNRFVDAIHQLSGSKTQTVKALTKANILVVEDEPINAEMLEYMLNSMGHDVTVSYTGDDAIGRVNETAYDCILLDINLPDINGLEVANIIKEGFPDLPIIALTANAHRNDKEASLKAGIRYHLVKPVTFQELKNTLDLTLV